jgi:hypothetical protein
LEFVVDSQRLEIDSSKSTGRIGEMKREATTARRGRRRGSRGRKRVGHR